MTVPRRVQLRRTKGWRKPGGVVTVARPSRFGNPFRIGGTTPSGEPIESREVAVALFRDWITGNPTVFVEHHTYMSANMHKLRGRDLACWCPTTRPCHADVLIELVNR